MKAAAAPCSGGGCSSGRLLLQGWLGGPPRLFDPGLEGHTEVGLTGRVARRWGRRGGRWARGQRPGLSLPVCHPPAWVDASALAPLPGCGLRGVAQAGTRARVMPLGCASPLLEDEVEAPQQPGSRLGPGGVWGRSRRWPCPRPAAGRCLENPSSLLRRGATGLPGVGPLRGSLDIWSGPGEPPGNGEVARPAERKEDFGCLKKEGVPDEATLQTALGGWGKLG